MVRTYLPASWCDAVGGNKSLKSIYLVERIPFSSVNRFLLFLLAAAREPCRHKLTIFSNSQSLQSRVEASVPLGLSCRLRFELCKSSLIGNDGINFQHRNFLHSILTVFNYLVRRDEKGAESRRHIHSTTAVSGWKEEHFQSEWLLGTGESEKGKPFDQHDFNNLT